MGKIKKDIVVKENTLINENSLYERVVKIIENRKYRAVTHANQETTMMFWEIGHHINSTVLDNNRATYGKKILTALAAKLMSKYGNIFSERNLYRMTLFAERFSNTKILPTLSAKLSWSHILELLPLKTDESRMYYANDTVHRNFGKRYRTEELELTF